MTTLLPAMTAPGGPTSATDLSVTAVLLATTIDDHLVDALLALAHSTRPAERVLILDASPQGRIAEQLEADAGVVHDLPPTRVERVVTDLDPHGALETAYRLDPAADAFWLLTGATEPDAAALGQLASLMQGSPATGVAGGKLLDAARPGRLRAFGIQVTRSGRLQPDPRPGQPDQQQYDDRIDAIAVPAEGMLVRASTYADLGGHDRWLGAAGRDLDFGWRAQLAGHRVGLAPRARILLSTAPPAPAGAQDRRDARRVALARRPWYVVPLLMVWIVLSSVAVGLLLLALKRPRAAARSLAEAGAVLDPWRTIAARRRGRAGRRIPSRDLRGLFVTAAQTRARVGDRLNDVIVPRRAAAGPAAAAARPLGRHGASAAPPERSLWSSPGLWGPVVLLALAAAAFRGLPGGAGAIAAQGLMGGEVRPLRADASALWHSWWDAWSGPGLGSADATSPGNAVLALATWLFQALPGEAGPSPASRVVGILLLAAPAAAFLSAYVAARTVTARRLPRAAVAAVWALTPAALAAVREGRLAALALLVALPLIAAGVGAMMRPASRPGAGAATALVTAALASVLPGALVAAALIGLALLLAGPAAARRRGAAYLAMTALAAAPTIAYLAHYPRALIGGWGLLAPADDLPLWQRALGIPGSSTLEAGLLGPGHGVADLRPGLLIVLAIPVLAVGALGLSRGLPGRAGTSQWLFAGIALAGLMLTLAAPRVVVDDAGTRAWAGTGALVTAFALLSAGLLAAGHRAQPLWRVLPSGVALAGALLLAISFVGPGARQDLRLALDPRPAVALDQAEGPLATRTLLLRGAGEGLTYEVLAREPGPVARDLGPSPRTDLDAPVAALTDTAAAADPVAGLREWAVGFVIADVSVDAALVRHLDATAGLTRISDYLDRSVWRVAAAEVAATARARAQIDRDSARTLPVTGAHGTGAGAAGGAAQVRLAEPAGFAEHAVVRADGTVLRAVVTEGGTLAYDLPAGTQRVSVQVPSRFGALGWLYLGLLLLLAYAALPLGRAPSAAPGQTAPAAPPSPTPPPAGLASATPGADASREQP